ncbi:MAG: hypothetical protein SWH61_05130 [Thermodesulfobacteriota bacterium]|nr:hypothetical protein [Thermodesulfobacteriota bacterium]
MKKIFFVGLLLCMLVPAVIFAGDWDTMKWDVDNWGETTSDNDSDNNSRGVIGGSSEGGGGCFISTLL